MRARRFVMGSIGASLLAVAAFLDGCGGDDVSISASDAASDATVDASADGAIDGGAGGDASADAAPPCDPPTDPTKSALCLRITPEGITFLADQNFDGKGLLLVDVHDTAQPDLPDGAPLPALATSVLPDGGFDGGVQLDLSAPIPVVRFDGLPQTVYPRVIFVDSRVSAKPTAGWWLGGYDLTNGLMDHPPLKPVTLTPGQGTTVTIDLTALRGLVVSLTLGTQPIGNAMGPASFAVMTDPAPATGTKVYGLGDVACANLADAGVARLGGFVFGNGPYYVFAQLDDFGTSGVLKPGTLTTLAALDGGIVNPPASQISYPASTYVVTQQIPLDLVVPYPDAGMDLVKCP
jgi:hypothetical protein